jgi:hypothetical protein
MKIEIWTQPYPSNNSFATYLDFIAASVTMLITVIMASGHAIYALNHVDPLSTILAFCKIRYYVIQSSSMMYRWSLSAACFDRYALSSANAHLRKFAATNVARRVVAIIVCIWLVLPIHILIFHSIRANACGPTYSVATALYHSIFTTIAGCIVPISFMLAFCLLTYRNLILKRKRHQHIIGQNKEEDDELSNLHRTRDHQVLLILLFQVFVFTLGTTPLMMWLFYNAITLSITNKSADQLAIERMVNVMVEALVNSFPVFSFYLYTITSHTFRDELGKLYCLAFGCRQLNQTSPIQPIINNIEFQQRTKHPHPSFRQGRG